MQNVVHNSKCDGVRDSELNEVGKEHSGSSSPLSGNLSVERGQSLTSLQSNFMADLSESDDDDVSEVESFILDQGDLEDDGMVADPKFLLADDVGDSGIDAETQCRLEALLQSSAYSLCRGSRMDSDAQLHLKQGVCDSVSTSLPQGLAKLSLNETKALADPEILKRLTSSVSCALDEAAAALNRMRTEPHTSVDHGDGRSLVEACTDGDICTVRRMLDEGRNVNEVTDEGESLLALACASGYYELAQLLLAMRANVEDRGLKDTTPLMEAASAGHADIVRLLIQHGADVNAQTSQDKKMKGAKIKNQELNMKAQQDTHSNLPSIVCPEGNTPLMFACAGGHEEVVSILLEAGANVEDHNENGHTPLMEAASAGHVGVAKLLVANGASINTHSNEFKESALTLACYKGHLEMVRFLLEAGADQEHKTDEMHTALMEASMDGHVEVARLLLDSGAQVNMPADSFESPLTLAACGGHVELAMLLLDRGANIEEVNDEGYTPLMEAAREGHEEMVALLLSQGADINAQTEETQETALTLACCGGFLEVADFLIKAGADIEIGASTPLMEASQEGHLELVRYLINAGANVNAQTATGDSALTYACENGHTDVSDLLLQAGAELEHESEGGRTPLMKAARAGHLCTVQFLISKGANVNKQTTNNDHNPLSLACAGGHLPVVELLLAHGADPTHKLKDNSTMLIEASKGGHTAVVQLLLDYPNSLLASPPATQEVPQIQSPTVEAAEAPRVPPHGLQVFSPQESEQTSTASSSYVASVQSVPRIQELLQVRDTLPGSSPQAAPKQKSLLRKNVLVKNNEAPSFSVSENIQRCHFRSSKTNASAQANSMSIQAETSNQKVLVNDIATNSCMGGSGGGGGGIESVEDKESKPSERLEACINSMMKKAELLHPNPEEQILQKQQILEELQRVERELQEKAQAQLLLTAQHQQHHPHLQGLGSVSAGSPTIATVTSNSVAAFPNVSGVHGQQLLLNSGTILDVGSLSSTVVPDLSGHLGINLRSTSATAHLSAPTSVQTIPAQQLYQHQKPVQQPVVASIASDHSKPRLSKQVTKQAKTSVPKQQLFQQGTVQNSTKVLPQSHLEEVEKMNLRNVVLTEQQQQQHQQLLHQHPQQQFVLSEFTQNLTLRANSHLSDGAADALALMQAAGGIKFDTSQGHGIPIFDPVSVGQALLQQQLQHQQQLQLQHQQQFTQVIQQETKRQQQQQQPLHYDKSAKSVKGKNSKTQQQTLLQTSQPQLQALQAQQSQQVVKQQLSSTCTDACTLVGNIPLDAAGVLTLGGMATPAFPVSLAVSPALPSVSIASSCGATYAHNISLEDSLMVASPPRTLHETLGDIMTGPTTQLAGNQIAVGQQSATSHCIEPNCLAAATSGVGVGLTMTSLPGGNSPSTSLPLAFHTLAPAATSCVPTQVTTAVDGTVTPHHIHISHGTAGTTTPAPPPLYPPIDLNSQTDSNHDTALTLACAGGHEELVSLLLSRGANIEHRDKKGFTPLMLAATAGHAGVVEILLNHGADIEAQSERTKDTALSLACSGGRIEVVDILLARGANKEHRNVSDYTPLSLAASGGYTNIIKLLLNHGAEINSRTGSKLGISPLMLAAMNGHTQAVKLLLDMGSDINAQIETNRNTALTLACFQGRHEVVSLLLDRKANVEHRAKTGLTPLMEAASGGYVEVGRVLLDKGADVNAPPVPSSRDTALTIAADKGHYRFVELLIQRDAIIDAKNKKGNSPLWLSCNGGHLDVVQLLAQSGADIDSQDNRKVSCLMAAFRKGHVKVVKWMVKHVSQFPSDQEMSRYISTLTDKDLLKKCHQCVEAIRVAKERQAAEANKNATILLEELDQESRRAENRRLAAARRRERKRKKKKEKQEQLRAAKAAAEETKKSEKNCDHRLLKQQQNQNSQPDSQSEAEDEEEEEDEEDEEEEDKDYLHEKCLTEEIDGIQNSRLLLPENSCSNKYKVQLTNELPSTEFPNGKDKEVSIKEYDVNHILDLKKNELSRSEKKRESDREKSKTQEKNKRNILCKSNNTEIRTQKDIGSSEKLSNKLVESNSNTFVNSSRNSKKRSQRQESSVISSSPSSTSSASSTVSKIPTVASSQNCSDSKAHNLSHKHHKHSKEILVNGMSMGEYDDICALFSAAASRGRTNKCPSDSKLTLESLGELALDLPAEVALSAGLRSPSAPALAHCMKSPLANSTSPKKWQKRDEGWKEVVRRSKKVSVPANAISRVIGRGGCNINAIREASGAHIEVEKQKGQGERTVIIRGSAESTRLAQQLITALIKEPEKELAEILIRCGLNRTISCNSSNSDTLRTTSSNTSSNVIVTTSQVISSNQTKSNSRQSAAAKSSGIVTSSITKASTIPPPSLPANAAPPFTNRTRPVVASTQNIRPGIPVCTVGTPPFLSTTQNAWTGVVASGKVPAPVTPRPSVPVCNASTTFSLTAVSTRVVATTSVDKNPIVRQLFPTTEKKSTSELQSTTTSTKTTVSYTMAVIAQGKVPKTVPASIVTVTTRVTATSDTKVSTIAPAQMERAGSAPPVPMPSMISSQVSVGQNANCGPSVQPFTVSQPSRTGSSQNSVNSQQGPPVSRVHGNQTPTQNKLFISTATSSNQVITSASTSASPTSCSTTTTAQSAIAQEYTPFNNLFSKVAQPSVWGQKDKETAKPNFASVAASGITSVSSQVQNSNPVQSTLMLSLPQTSEPEMIVDAAKAPGYRGNLHISPSASSNSSASSSSSQHTAPHSSNFGPIGSGPRSAPCTPPLGPIGPPSAGTNARHSTPPAVPSPPPALHSRSLPDSNSGALNDLPRSMTSGMGPPHMTSQMSEVIFHHQGLNMSSHPSRLSSYPLTSTVAGPAGTNTTFSQHSPLSSVGTITPEGASNGNIPVVQSNLNPNAPDFSSRASLLMAQHCPPMHHLGPRLPPGPNTFQENAVPPPIASFRPMLTTTGGLNPTFPLHPIPNPHTQAMNRFPFHHAPNHQQQTGDYSQNAPAGPVGTLPPGMGAISQGTDGVPVLNMIGGFPAQAMSQVLPGSGTIPHHYPGIQSMMGIRPSQRSASTTPSVGASSKDEGSPMATMSPNASPQGSNLPSPTGMNVQENPNPAGTIGEDRKLPRPIGMERAQRKNPMYGGVSDIGSIWSFGSSNRSDMPTSADWIANMPAGISTIPPMPQEEQLPSMMHNNYGANRFADMITSEGNQPIEHPYQAVAGGYPFMNGVPPHMLTPHLYQAAVAASNAPAQMESAVEMWGVHQKIPLSSGGDGVPQAVDPKLTWHSWSPHQA